MDGFTKNVNTFTDYGVEAQDIERRRKMAELLQQQALQPIEQTTAGGYVTPISWTQGLAKALQGYAGMKGQEKATQEQRDLAGRAKMEAQDYFGGMPQAKTTDLNPVAMDDEGNAMPPALQTTQPTRQELMSYALKGSMSGNPLVQPVAGSMLAQYIKQDEPYTLAPGATRYGAGNTPIATAPVAPKAPEPFTLTPGQQRFGPDGKPIAALPEKVDYNKPFLPDGSPNPAYQQYEFGKAGAGATRIQTNVNSYTPASEEAQRDFIKSTRVTYDALKQAPVALQSIEAAKALIPAAKGFMGTGGESLLEAAKFLNNRIGTNIDTEGVKSAEELRTRIFFNIMDNLKKMDAQPSQQQQEVMRESLGKLGTDPNALPNVLDAFGDVMKGKIALHNQEVQSAIQRGVKFPYDPIIKIPELNHSVSKPAVIQGTPKVRKWNPVTQRLE